GCVALEISSIRRKTPPCLPKINHESCYSERRCAGRVTLLARCEDAQLNSAAPAWGGYSLAEHEIPADIAALSFEDALKQPEELVRQLEKGESRLDDAIQAYERGSHLKRHCESKLAEARLKVERISFGPGGEIGTEPMDRG